MTRRGLAVLSVVGALATAGPAHAYFGDVDVGARGQGMGTAGAAMIDDVTAYYWNPSALDRMTRRQAAAFYGRPLGVAGLYESGLAYGGRLPLARGVGFAAAWQRYGVEDVYSEDRFLLSAGRTVTRLDSGHELALGGSIKLGRIGVASYADPLDGSEVDFGSRSAWSFDTAVGWRTPFGLDATWVAYDWNEPDFGFVEGSSGTHVERSHRLAAAYRWNPESTVGAAWTSGVGTAPARFDLGLEIEFFDVFAIRSGLTDLGGVPDPGTSPTRFQYAGGIGLLNERWTLDAAVATTRELGTTFSFSLVVPLGRPFAEVTP